MNSRKFISGVSALAIAASSFAAMAVTASAEEATLNAEQFVAVNGNDETTSATSYTEAPVSIGQSKISSGKLTADSNKTWALARFNVSGYADYTIGTATINYDVTASASYNSGMALGTVEMGSDWVAADTNYNNVNGVYAAASLVNKNSSNLIWSTKGQTNTVTYDVTDTIKSAINDSNGIVTFYIATTTGREQSLATVPTLKVTYAAKALAGAVNVSYVCGSEVIGTAQPSVAGLFAGDDLTFAFPAYVKSGDKYYKADETGFNKTVALTDAAQDATVAYVEADEVVDFAEVSVSNRVGHAAFANPAVNINASAGMDGGAVYGQTGTGCTQTFTVPVNGNYDITVNAVGTSSKTRAVYLTVDTTDVDETTPKLACDNGSTAVQTINVDLTAGEHTFYFMSDGAISPLLDYMVVKLVKEAEEEQELTAPDVDITEIISDKTASDVSDKVKLDGTDTTFAAKVVPDIHGSEDEYEGPASLWHTIVTRPADSAAANTIKATAYIDGKEYDSDEVSIATVSAGAVDVYIAVEALENAVEWLKVIFN